MASPFNIIDGRHSPDFQFLKCIRARNGCASNSCGERYDLKGIMRTLDLHTVRERALPRFMGECWEHGTATFMILGDICTRACGFCAKATGKPVGPPDEEEPHRVAVKPSRAWASALRCRNFRQSRRSKTAAHTFSRARSRKFAGAYRDAKSKC